MNYILWIVFAACLLHQGNCGNYWLGEELVTSHLPEFKVAEDKRISPQTNVTITKDISSATFIANILEYGIIDRATVKGDVCEAEEGTSQAFINQIIYETIGVQGCPFPVGEYEVKQEMIRENVNIPELDEKFSNGIIRINIFKDGNERDNTYDILIWVSIQTLTDEELEEEKQRLGQSKK
ncbi:uncharacterized protein LOC107038588 [Diachasma alloeum]|uniref:uncharacterized protein LOC107038588 n=1 Tax=Diachasma alloeum TaxID=454923 RepID=UPI0007381201|nr:uncharacterized protein LOC107038588 [Diachasma alloeum]